MRKHTFSARITRFEKGISLHVVMIPANVSKALGEGSSVPVVAAVNGVTEVRTTLFSVGKGKRAMVLKSETRKLAKIGEGDLVTIVLAKDDRPPLVEPTPEDLAEALRDEQVLEAFERISRGRRNQYLRWLEEAAMEETREKRIHHLVGVALAAREKEIDRG